MIISLHDLCFKIEKQKLLADAEHRRQTDLLAQHQAEVIQLKNKVATKLKVSL